MMRGTPNIIFIINMSIHPTEWNWLRMCAHGRKS